MKAIAIKKIAIHVKYFKSKMGLIIAVVIRILKHYGIFNDKHILVECVNKIVKSNGLSFRADIVVTQSE